MRDDAYAPGKLMLAKLWGMLYYFGRERLLMKKTLKKAISVALCVVMLAMIASTAVADDTSDSVGNPETLYFSHVGHGQYETTRQRSAGAISATVTEGEGLYHIEGERYLSRVDDNRFLLVDRINMPIESAFQRNSIYRNYQMPEYVVNRIERTIAQQKALGNDDLEISIFMPGVVVEPQDSEQIAPLSTTTSYYWLNGHRLRDTTILMGNMAAGPITNTGSNVFSTAGALIDLSVGVAGMFVSVPLFTAYGIGMSALAVYRAVRGPVVRGSSTDQIQMNLVYQRWDRLTSVEVNGVWHLGCISERVVLQRVYTWQFFADNGQTYRAVSHLSQLFVTENFGNPGPTAIRWWASGGWADAPITTRVLNTTVVF